MKTIFALLVFFSNFCLCDESEFLASKGAQALKDKEKHKALYFLHEAIEKNASNLDAYYYLGALHFYDLEGIKGLPFLKKCLNKDPKNEQYRYAYAICADSIGYHDLALQAFEEYYGAEPASPEIRTKLLPLYLRNMDWYYASKLCKINDLWWYNKELRGKTVLLDLSSQWNGRGDIILQMRYAKRLHTEGARVIVYVRHQLKELLSECPFVGNVIYSDQPKPAADYEFSLTTDRLTLVMKDTLYEPSHDIPYIFANDDLTQKWKMKLSANKDFKIGLCFQSIKMQDYFTNQIIPGPRAIEPSYLLPFFSIPHVSFYNLQVGEDKSMALLRQQSNFYEFPEMDLNHGRFMDTAALMKSLDLVITVDTSIAHLAGSMGVPVWTLLSFSADARWFSNRDDSPWYPTMKLFRQPELGNWKSVITQICTALLDIIAH